MAARDEMKRTNRLTVDFADTLTRKAADFREHFAAEAKHLALESSEAFFEALIAKINRQKEFNAHDLLTLSAAFFLMAVGWEATTDGTDDRQEEPEKVPRNRAGAEHR